jgi:hypothetical protein
LGVFLCQPGLDQFAAQIVGIRHLSFRPLWHPTSPLH